MKTFPAFPIFSGYQEITPVVRVIGLFAGAVSVFLLDHWSKRTVEARLAQSHVAFAGIAFVSVSMAGGTDGELKYAALNPPVTLSAGATYYIVSQEIAGGDQFRNHNTMVQTTDAASVISGVKGGPPYVQDSPVGTMYGPVDFQY